MHKLGLTDRSSGANGERTRLRNQMRRLFSCSVSLVYADAQHEVRVHSFVADRAEFWWDVKRPAAPVLWDSTIQLGEQFFNEIIAHPIPLDLNILKSLKRSPLGLDLYLWLTYRTFGETPAAPHLASTLSPVRPGPVPRWGNSNSGLFPYLSEGWGPPLSVRSSDELHCHCPARSYTSQ